MYSLVVACSLLIKFARYGHYDFQVTAERLSQVLQIDQLLFMILRRGKTYCDCKNMTTMSMPSVMVTLRPRTFSTQAPMTPQFGSGIDDR